MSRFIQSVQFPPGGDPILQLNLSQLTTVLTHKDVCWLAEELFEAMGVTIESYVDAKRSTIRLETQPSPATVLSVEGVKDDGGLVKLPLP